ncbi:hypothetical protein [Arthrobacter sp. AL12]|uniref:hypothetical protein n=1 Tax=Arthrobacter sp. AL12 TaxID=3042241 RepID=UPI00249CA8D8|nr:hypothetical protein [Arthrobacter sp. AL12]MDI3211060.1 hypothetical protein [Arthrobacter sp. AL12]
MVRDIDDLPVDVVLLLVDGTVPPWDRGRPAVAAQQRVLDHLRRLRAIQAYITWSAPSLSTFVSTQARKTSASLRSPMHRNT